MLDNYLGDFNLPEDDEELLIENLSPVRNTAREKSGKFMFSGHKTTSHEKNEKINANAATPLKTFFGDDLSSG